MVKAKLNSALLIVLFTSLLILYANTFTEFSDAHSAAKSNDGLEYALQIDRLDIASLFEPHHLLYHITGFVFHKVIVNIPKGSVMCSIWSLKLMSTIFAVSGIALFYLLLLEIHRDRFSALIASLSLAFSTSYWFFSSTPETHVVDVCLTALILYLLVKLCKMDYNSRWFLILGGIQAIAICFRLDNILLLLITTTAIFLLSKRREMLKKVFFYLLATFIITAAVYILCYSFIVKGQKDIYRFIVWLLDSDFSVSDGTGILAHLTISNLFNSSLETLQSICANISYLFLILVLPIVYLLFKPNLRSQIKEKKIIAVCLLWVLIRILFFTWFSPQEIFLYSARTSIPIVLILSFLISSTNSISNRPMRILHRLLYSSIPLIILVSSIVHLLPLRGASYYRFGLNYISSKGDLIITDANHFGFFMDYHFNLKPLWLFGLTDFDQPINENESLARIKQAYNEHLFDLTDLYEPQTKKDMLRRINETHKKGGNIYVVLDELPSAALNYIPSLKANYKIKKLDFTGQQNDHFESYRVVKK